MTFGIDIDEVLRDTLSQMLRVYNREFHDNKTKKDIHSFVVEDTFPRIEAETGINPAEWFFQLHSKEIFEDSSIITGALEAINILKEYGNIIIISYQKTMQNKISALNWLSKHNIPYDGICFMKNKTLLHVDYFVDDNDWNFINCNAKHGILVNAPYNKGKNLNTILKNSNCQDMRKVPSLFAFACWIKMNNK